MTCMLGAWWCARCPVAGCKNTKPITSQDLEDHREMRRYIHNRRKRTQPSASASVTAGRWMEKSDGGEGVALAVPLYFAYCAGCVCVSCTVQHVICMLYSVCLYSVYCVRCSMCCILCTVQYVFVFCVLCTVQYVYFAYCAVCICVLCTVQYGFSFCILCRKYLYSAYCVLCSMYLYSAYCTVCICVMPTVQYVFIFCVMYSVYLYFV